MESQERCFYKIAHITVAKCHRVPNLFFFFLINAISKLSNEDVGACGRGTHQAKS